MRSRRTATAACLLLLAAGCRQDPVAGAGSAPRRTTTAARGDVDDRLTGAAPSALPTYRCPAQQVSPAQSFFPRPPGTFYDATTQYTYHFGTEMWLAGSDDAETPILTYQRSILTGTPVSGGQAWTHSFRFTNASQPPFDLTGAFDPAGDTDSLDTADYLIRVQLEALDASLSGSRSYWLVPIDIGKPQIQNINVWQDGEGSVYVEARVKDNCSPAVVGTLSGQNSEKPGVTQLYSMISLGGNLYGGVLKDLGKTGLYTLTVTAVDDAGNIGSRSIDVEASYSGSFGYNYFSTSCPAGDVGSCGDPVNTASGNFTYHTTDLHLPGPGDSSLDVTRAYNSKSEEVGPFGRGWTFPFGFRLELVDNLLLHGVKAHLPDGRTLLFRDEGGGRFTTLTPGATDVLTSSGGELTLRQKRLTTYHFDATGRLSRVLDPNGNAVSLRWSGGHVVRVENSAGRWLNLQYAGDLVTEISGPEGAVVKYGYDGALLTSFTDLRDRTRRYRYDGGGRLAALLRPSGSPSVRLRYSEHGRVVEQIEGEAALHAITYDDPGHLRTLTDAAGRTVIHRYDDQSRLVRVTDALGYEEAFGYDDQGRRISFKDKAGASWHYTYDDRGNALTEAGPLGWTREREYSDLDEVLLERDALGREKRFEYDGLGNLTAQTDPAGGRTELVYDSRGLPTQVTDPAGFRTLNAYDAAGDLVRTTDAAGGVTEHTYDGLGRETSTTRPNGAVLSRTYDLASPLLATVHGPLGWALLVEYDGDGEVVRQVDGNGAARRQTYDASGRRSAEIDPLGAVTSYRYGPMGELLSRTDPEGHTTTFEYDDRLMEVAAHAPEGATTRKVRDAKGNVSAEIDAEGRETDWIRDALDRVVERIQNARPGAPDSADTNVRTWYAYDLANNLLRIDSPRGVATTAAYDALDRRLEEVRNARPGEPAGASTNVTTRFAYDAVGNVVSRTDPRGGTTTLRFDGMKRVISKRDALGHTTAYRYDAEGHLVATTDPAGRVTAQAYDVLGRRVQTVRNAVAGHAPDGDTNVTEVLTYDPAGNVVSRRDPRGFITTYRYDLAGRLVGATDPSGADTRYTYDRAGTRPRSGTAAARRPRWPTTA